MNKFRIISVFVLLAMLISLAGVSPATATLVDTPWMGSGTGTTTVVSDGSGAPAQFTYYSWGVYNGAWMFSTTATAAGARILDWNYQGFHAWYQVRVRLDAFIDNGTTITTVNLVNDGPVNCCTPPSGGFNYSGTYTFDVQPGDLYGFKMQGSNYDIDWTLRGTLTVDENLAPSANAGGPYSGDEGSPISLDGSGSFDPEALASCQDIRDFYPTAVDGEYAIFPNGQWFTVYCHDMAGTPQEYLSLVNTGGSSNFSQYTSGGASPGTDVRTSYEKVRIDPQTLLVDISDQTFATSTGLLWHSGVDTVTSMPYGVAMGCDWNSPNGAANIDLQGTPFAVSDTFILGGAYPVGSSVFSVDDRVVDLTGGGFCGWIMAEPGGYNPFNNYGGFQLNLEYTGSTLIVEPLTYAWSVDSPLCSFDDATSPTPNLTCSDNGDFIVTLVVDDGVATDSATAAVTVNNVAPTVSIDSVLPTLAAVGTPVAASGSFTDPGTNDAHTAAWDWGDASTSAGSVSGLMVGPDGHIYTEAGVYQIQLEVTDDDGGSGSALYQFVVVYDPTDGFVTGGGWFMSPAGAYYPAGLPSFGDSVYQVVPSSLNWADANAAASASQLEGCSSAHLATITSQEEQDAIYNSFGGDAIAFAWLGAHLVGGEWQWISGEPWDYTNWQVGEPTGEGENALMVGGGGTPSDGGWIYDGKWNDTPDTGLLDKYIVEYEDCLVGKASFGFVSKYQKGANVPTGNTEFQFQAAGLNFHSSSYEWLVVTGSNFARFKGVGTLNGEGEYLFMIWAGDETGSAGADTFRIKIWTEEVPGVEVIIYDNGMDQAISGGNILVHSN